MAITTPDALINAIANNSQFGLSMSRSVANQLAAGYTDLWLYQDWPRYTINTSDTPGRFCRDQQHGRPSGGV